MADTSNFVVISLISFFFCFYLVGGFELLLSRVIIPCPLLMKKTLQLPLETLIVFSTQLSISTQSIHDCI